MTHDKSKKAREFWLVGCGDISLYPACTAFDSEEKANDVVDMIKRSNDPHVTHVIEYSRVIELEREVEMARDRARLNMQAAERFEKENEELKESLRFYRNELTSRSQLAEATKHDWLDAMKENAALAKIKAKGE